MKILQKITIIAFILVMSVSVINAFAAEDTTNAIENNNDTSVVITKDKERDMKLQIHKNDDGKIIVFLPDDGEQVLTADNSIDITIKNAEAEEVSMFPMVVTLIFLISSLISFCLL